MRKSKQTVREISFEMKIPIGAKIIGNDLVVDSLRMVIALMGSKAASGNLHMYKIEKLQGNKWKIPIEAVRERRRVIEERIMRDREYLNFIVEALNIVDSMKNKRKEENTKWKTIDD